MTTNKRLPHNKVSLYFVQITIFQKEALTRNIDLRSFSHRQNRNHSSQNSSIEFIPQLFIKMCEKSKNKSTFFLHILENMFSIFFFKILNIFLCKNIAVSYFSIQPKARKELKDLCNNINLLLQKVGTHTLQPTFQQKFIALFTKFKNF